MCDSSGCLLPNIPDAYLTAAIAEIMQLKKKASPGKSIVGFPQSFAELHQFPLSMPVGIPPFHQDAICIHHQALRLNFQGTPGVTCKKMRAAIPCL